MDKLLIEDLVVEGRIGAYEWERATPQTIGIDLEMAIDAAAAAAADEVRSALDYAKLVACVREVAQEKPYVLMETLAEALAARLLREFRPPSVRVRVKKRSLPGIGYAAVELERKRRRLPASPRRMRPPVRMGKGR